MAVKNYGIHDKWTDLDKLNNVDIKSVDGVIESVKINGEEAGGGGGSSDFSTAEVTVVNNTGELINGSFVCVRDTPISTVVPLNTLPFNSSTNFTVPLYKGNCAWKITSGTLNISVSGDIEWNSGSRTAFITGDGTITISAG